MAENKDKIIVALDTPSMDAAERIVKDLEGIISFYKVGCEFFAAHGWRAVEFIKKQKARVFLDLKLHDIPNTVSKTMAVLCEHEVDMVTVHTLGGFEMMQKTTKIANERAATGKHKPLILGVTILTSHSDKQLKEDLGIERSVEDQVSHLAELANRAGFDGVISSPHETKRLRSERSNDFLIVTPGVRPMGSDLMDQKRTFTPKDALAAGANFLVIGRPITGESNPKEAAIKIIKSI